MFKDYDKYLRESLKVYLFILVIIVILKLVGLDYFGIDTTNNVIIKVNDFCLNYHLTNLWYFITLFVYVKVIVSIGADKQLDIIKTIVITLISLILFVLVKPHLNALLSIIFDYFYLLAIILILNRFKDIKSVLKRYTIVVLINIIFQLISLFIRDVGNNQMYYNNFILGIVMNIDYILLSVIMYNVYFMKGGKVVCGEVFSFSQMKVNLKNLQKRFQKNYSNFKKLNKQEKATIIIYTILSLIWNTFTLGLVLLISILNDTFIECIFILTSFWLSKKVFGKPFHLKSMTQCFIVSNITYYVLNRITTPTGISILIPIMLGVGLSYITSKLVKRTYKPLYKGMPKEVFEDTILKVVDKDSDKYNICYEYFIEKQNAIYLSHKHNYTEAGIRKITSRVNDEIKALNN